MARPSPFASSAVGHTSTTSTTATPSTSTELKSAPSRSATLRRSSSPARALLYALPGNSEAVLQTTEESPRIYALYAGSTTTERLGALARRQLSPQTPFNADAWELAFTSLGLFDSYHSVISILRSGANAGIPIIHQTFAPPNTKSVAENSALFESLMLHEFESERFYGPFTAEETERALDSPFQTSPISLVPKPNSNPPKFRPVNNLSYPHTPIPRSPSSFISSINYSIDADNYPCTWGTFAVCSLLIARLPPGSQAAVRDVSEAYRRVPIVPAQWPGTVVRLTDTLFAINVALLFGLVSSGGIWGLIADALCAILRASGIGPLCKWVDDFIFFRVRLEHLPEYNRKQRKWAARILTQGGKRQSNSRIWFAGGLLPDGTVEEFDNELSFPLLPQPSSKSGNRYSCDINDIDAITDPLGVPWAKEKDQPFSSRPTYIGFYWDLQERTVGLPDKKKAKYLTAIDVWQNANPPTHTLKEAQELHGKLQHAAHILPAGRAYLTALESFLGVFGD
ncbi:hypothetical protein SCHPADRAFT_948152, partial [Schizopora paradoxa]